MRAFSQVLWTYPIVDVPLVTSVDPFTQPLVVISGLDEELNFHLFELSSTEGKVPGRDLVSERFSDLADAKGQFLASRIQHVLEVHEDSLSCFWAEENFIRCVFHRSHECLEHQVKSPRFAQLTVTVRTLEFL